VRGPMGKVHDLTRTASLYFTRPFSLSAPGLPPQTIYLFVTINFSTALTSNHSASTWCAVDTSHSSVMEFLTFFLDPIRAKWKRRMRRSTVHLQWISMNPCLLEIVCSCYFRPLIIFSSSVSQMRPLLPNTCQNSVTMSRSSESLHGSLRVGRSSKRSSPVQSLNVADIAGECQVHLFHVSYLHLGAGKAHITLPLW
jgi:hypothetical protein